MTSPSIPPTSDFDLRDFEHNETITLSSTTTTYDDELEAIELLREETILRNRKEGKVIQHRAWPVPEAFRSECEYPQETPSRPNYTGLFPTLPSSPPLFLDKMPVSSPIAYPASSSPPRKRHHASKPAKRGSPLKEQTPMKQNRPRMGGGFVLDDSSDEDEEPARKKRMLKENFVTSIPEENDNVGPVTDSDDREMADMAEENIYMNQEDEDALEALNSMENSDSAAQEKPKSIFASFKRPPPRPSTATKDQEETIDSATNEFSKSTSIFPQSKPTTEQIRNENRNRATKENDEDQSFVSLLDETDSFSTEYPLISSLLRSKITTGTELRTCSGRSYAIQPRKKSTAIAFEQMIAARSTTKAGRAKKSYYGIDIHQLIEEAESEIATAEKEVEPTLPQNPLPSIEKPPANPKKTLMWTEKYRARKFTDLVGDDRTHRHVLKWLKGWDEIVFPRAAGSKPKLTAKKFGGPEEEEEKYHRKILLLTGPPGLGKTTLAHVCARQAGYEVTEINASDDRSSNVVKGRIRDSVGTESVKTVTGTTAGKSARPVCVVVDEVDGVVSGSGGSGGEGGFIKALIDLIVLDQKNSSGVASVNTKKKKGDKDRFRLMRPIILICNDLYHPSLRPIRHASFAEIIHIKPPPLDAVIARMSSVFAREGIEADTEGVRRLCEATWGMSAGAKQSGREASGTGEGDLRGILVVGESVARQLKSSSSKARLSRQWVEQNMISTLSSSGSGARGVGRGGTKEIVQRIFMEGGGFPKPSFAAPSGKAFKSYKLDEQPKTKLGVAEVGLKAAMGRLGEMVETSGEIERILTDVFATYPDQNFQDDTFLSKPDKAYEWFSFHDSCSSRVYSNQEWELLPYLSQPVLACHTLFSSISRHQNWSSANSSSKFSNNKFPTAEDAEAPPVPFSGLMADRDAREAEKANRALLSTIQSSLSHNLTRTFRSPESIAVELAPYIVKMLTPDVKPVIVGGSGGGMSIASVRKESEKNMVKRAVDVMNEVGVVFEKGRLEDEDTSIGGGKYAPSQWVYRMDPALDDLATYETATPEGGKGGVGVRYAVRQVLDQEYQKSILVRENKTRQARYHAGSENLSSSRPGSSDGTHVPAAPDHQQQQPNHERIMTTGRLKAHVMQDDQPVAQKRDFFGRAVLDGGGQSGEGGNGAKRHMRNGSGGGGKRVKDDDKVWVSFHEGFSNAVRRPVRVEDILRGL